MDLTILIPCLNEARTIATCVDKAMQFLGRAGLTGEVVVSDNGSTDGSVDIAQSRGARVVHAARRGYGAALLAGIEAAHGRWVVMADGDDSYDLSRLDGFVAALEGGAALVIGDRFRGGIQPGAMPFLHRYLGNPVLSWIGRLFFKVPVSDFHCGIRAFDVAAIRALHLRCEGMEFATEMVGRAALAGLKIEEVPTTLHPDGRDRPPHLRTWRDGWRHLFFMLLISPRWLFLVPGAVLGLLGCAGLMLLGSSSVSFSGVGFDIHTLLYCAGAAIIGFLLVNFAVLLRWLSVQSGLTPAPNWFRLARRLVRPSAAFLFGASAVIFGIFWLYGVAVSWASQGYGSLDPRVAMRSVIPALTLMVMGMQACATVLLMYAMRVVLGLAEGGAK